jgi:MFS family permease
LNNGSTFIAYVSLFAALDVVMGALPALPMVSVAAFIKPFEGIALGSLSGPLAALIGGIIGMLLFPAAAGLGLYTFSTGVVGAAVAGLIVDERPKLALLLMAIPLGAFLANPIGREVALPALYDQVIALFLLYPSYIAWKKARKDVKYLPLAMFLVAFVGTEADNLTGNAIFVDLHLYSTLWGIPASSLYSVFLAGAFFYPLGRVLVALANVVIGAPALIALKKSKLLNYPLT